MKNALKIFGFTILVAAFYSYVGQMVPQKEAHPPETREFGANLTTAELVEIGEEIVGGKGTCLTCHTIGEAGTALRFPDLGGIGATAAARKEGQSDVEYLAESLYEPNAYVVEGFQAGMPQVSRPPINLTDAEILAVIAYLQSLGGTPTVTMETELAYHEGDLSAPPGASGAAAPVETAAATPEAEPRSGEALFSAYICNTCHSLDAPTPLVGPSLYDVGSRLSKAEIYEALLEPDATVAEGFPAGVMGNTLQGMGFYDRVSSQELKVLVDFLAEHTGG